MTDTIEQKALALIKPGATCEVNLENISILAIALTRAIEQHEAFRQEVSEAVEWVVNSTYMPAPSEHKLRRFIIANPDPLAECLLELDFSTDDKEARHDAEWLVKTIEKRGGKIVWGEG